MKIQEANTAKGPLKKFVGSLESAFTYNTKAGTPILVLACRSKDGKPETFSNFKDTFDQLSCGIETVEPGAPVTIAYDEYTSEATGKTYKNFKTVSFKPRAVLEEELKQMDCTWTPDDEEAPF